MSDRAFVRAGRASAILVAMAFAITLLAMVHAWPHHDPAAMPAIATAGAVATGDADWQHYGRDQGGTRFSHLAQIRPDNVGRLEVAWIARTGPSPKPDGSRGNFEATPIKIGENLYLCTSDNVVLALDAATGRTRWRFDPRIAAERLPPFRNCRGVAYLRTAASGVCAERIYTGTLDAALWALDAATGRPCADFGAAGRVDLLRGMNQAAPGYYFVNSAPTVVRGKIVVGGVVSDNQYVGEPSGVIRAFDGRTGRLAWAWDVDHPDRHGEPPPGETYGAGTPNAWAPMSADDALGLVFVPTGNATPDFVAMHRSPGSQRYGSSVVAIDAETGIARWSFQTVHHDIWDYDVASQPTAFDMPIGGGRTIPALLQPTKTAQLFVLDRRTGRPITRVRERPVPQDGGVPGERLSATQPFSVGMPSLAGPDITERQMWGLTPFDQLWCRIRFRELRYEGAFTPSSVQGTLKFPGYAGGMNWGSASIDPERRILLVNSNRFASVIQLLPRPIADRMGAKPSPVPGPLAAQQGTAYGASVFGFLSPLFVPCQQPPYGFLTAIDLATRRVLWNRPFGTARDSGPLGHALGLPIPLGPPNMGGSITTGGGLTFIAASQENALRAFDTRSGRELWKGRLPAGGQATPMTFTAGSRRSQYVVVAAGGFLGWTHQGDYLVAFRLRQDERGE